MSQACVQTYPRDIRILAEGSRTVGGGGRRMRGQDRTEGMIERWLQHMSQICALPAVTSEPRGRPSTSGSTKIHQLTSSNTANCNKLFKVSQRLPLVAKDDIADRRNDESENGDVKVYQSIRSASLDCFQTLPRAHRQEKRLLQRHASAGTNRLVRGSSNVTKTKPTVPSVKQIPEVVSEQTECSVTTKDTLKALDGHIHALIEKYTNPESEVLRYRSYVEQRQKSASRFNLTTTDSGIAKSNTSRCVNRQAEDANKCLTQAGIQYTSSASTPSAISQPSGSQVRDNAANQSNGPTPTEAGTLPQITDCNTPKYLLRKVSIQEEGTGPLDTKELGTERMRNVGWRRSRESCEVVVRAESPDSPDTASSLFDTRRGVNKRPHRRVFFEFGEPTEIMHVDEMESALEFRQRLLTVRNSTAESSQSTKSNTPQLGHHNSPTENKLTPNAKSGQSSQTQVVSILKKSSVARHRQLHKTIIRQRDSISPNPQEHIQELTEERKAGDFLLPSHTPYFNISPPLSPVNAYQSSFRLPLSQATAPIVIKNSTYFALRSSSPMSRKSEIRQTNVSNGQVQKRLSVCVSTGPQRPAVNEAEEGEEDDEGGNTFQCSREFAAVLSDLR